MKRRLFCFLLAVLLAAGAFAACGETGSGEKKGLTVAVTVFPLYDWLRNIMGECFAEADVTLLLDSGVDLHSYQPSAQDLVKLSACDLFIYVGGESDDWVEDALNSIPGKPETLGLLAALGDNACREEAVEGMEESGEEEEGWDEHIWLSPKTAILCCDAIADALVSLDPAHREVYLDGHAAYAGRLADLDLRYGEAVAGAAGKKVLLFADRFPFRYLAADYGLTCYAAFSGCSAESEASFATVTFLAKKLKELMLPAVIRLEGGDGRLAGTVIGASGREDVKVLTMDSLQSATLADAGRGVTWLSVMESNLAVLKEALS